MSPCLDFFCNSMEDYVRNLLANTKNQEFRTSVRFCEIYCIRERRRTFVRSDADSSEAGTPNKSVYFLEKSFSRKSHLNFLQYVEGVGILAYKWFNKSKMKRPRFSSDLSREDFEKIRPVLDSARKTTRPKIHDTYEIMCAVLFFVRNKTPWRSLPQCFPPWRSVHHHFIQWTTDGPTTSLETALEMLRLHEDASSVRALISERSPPIK